MKIKKTELTETEKIVEVTADKIASSIYEDNYYSGICYDDLFSDIEDELNSDDTYSYLSDEDKDQILGKIAELYNRDVKAERKEELKQLCDRKHIISAISRLVENYDPYDVGDIGFSLSAEEILDEILKNGNK